MLTKQTLQRSEEGIDSSEFYLSIVTTNMLADEKCLYEWNYAKYKKKPSILLIKKGTIIPKDMLKDANVICEFEWETKEDIGLLSKKISEIIMSHDKKT